MDWLCARVRYSLPHDLPAIHLGTDNVLAGIKVQPADHVHIVPYSGQSRTFSRCRLPLRIKGLSDAYTEVFALLHALDVGLQATHELVDKFIPRNILRWIGLELLIVVLVARFSVFVDNAGLGTEALNSLNHEFVLAIIFEKRLGIGWTEARTTNIMDTLEIAHAI